MRLIRFEEWMRVSQEPLDRLKLVASLMIDPTWNEITAIILYPDNGYTGFAQWPL
jgi:hypothetical protein